MYPRGGIFRILGRCVPLFLLCCGQWIGAAQPVPDESDGQQAASYEVGLAKVDITPDYPIRLSGFTGRREESEGIRQRIYARAMAFRREGEPAVLVTVESIAIPPALREEVARRIHTRRSIASERLAICATHTHTAPALSSILPTMYGEPVPPEHQQRIDRYTRELTDRVEQAAFEALDDLQPSRLSFGVGTVGFAINRRTPGGPVDHDLPLLAITAPDGQVRGLYVSYACHCVVFSDKKISGDWAGYAAEKLEKEHPGAVALVSIGCGADANPESRANGEGDEIAERYGREIAAEVDRLLRGNLAEVHGLLQCKLETIMLPLAPLPPREHWEEQAQRRGADGYYAQVQLARIDRGEELPTEVPYPIQSWKFGDSLAMVFLPGEVVVDYALRLKKEFDASRLWVNAYANDCPGYIPSERILQEGGYEAGEAMRYYGLPAWFAPGLEEKILSTIRDQLGERFQRPEEAAGTQGVPPKTPGESLSTIQVRDDLRVELVAAEPMIRDPVAIDFGPDGKVWVAEMIDYGYKDDDPGPPMGRVTVLEDRNGDGRFDHASTFLEQIAGPMGVTVWRKGVLICAAPDILYAEDTTGDGKADVVQQVFSGFGTQNPQARVNSLTYGLDGWLYAACSFGGTIQSHPRGEEYLLADRDFRMKPDLGKLEPETGRTQQGRVRDDWGNWFGCDNSHLGFHYPLSDRYLRRNPHVVPPSLAVAMAGGPAAQLFPRGELVLFELSGPPGKPTSACGVGVYRDELLGAEMAGNVFTCEPVNQLVHRMVLQPAGTTFVGRRAAEEADSEFLTSTDNWFRPVQARTGPDGALWIVDMYRYVIEHARWIPQSVLETLDVRAGNELGRIYRVVPRGGGGREFPRLDKLDTRQLAAAMDSPNGWQRDMVQQMLVWRGDNAAVAPLERLATQSQRPATRLQALCTLDLLGKLRDERIETALRDPHAGVRRQAVRLAEPRLNTSPKLAGALLKLVDDPDPFVALQLACSLGEMDDLDLSTAALANIAGRHAEDPYVVTAVLTSVRPGEVGRLIQLAILEAEGQPSMSLLAKLAELAGTMGDPHGVEVALDAVAHGIDIDQDARRFSPLAVLLAGIARSGQSAEELVCSRSARRMDGLIDECLHLVTDVSIAQAVRIDCVRVLGRSRYPEPRHVRALGSLLTAEHDPDLQFAAIESLALRREDEVAQELLRRWSELTPRVRTRVLDVLLSRSEWVRELLRAIESQTVQVSEIGAAPRARLAEHPDRELRELAARHIAQGSYGERTAVVARYAESLPTGDAARGEMLFQKHCATCHRFRGIGDEVGPDLAVLKDRSADMLLTEILDPNRAVDPRYAEYVAVTVDGRSLNGILVEETSNAITLRGPQREEFTLLRSELDSLFTTGKSLMPEGFENVLSISEMADLLRFLDTP